MAALATLERWYRRLEPGGASSDVDSLRWFAAAWPFLWASALCVGAGAGRSSWVHTATLTSVTLVAGVGVLALPMCRAAPRQAVTRAAALAWVLGASAFVIALALRFDMPGGIGLYAGVVPPLTTLALSAMWDWTRPTAAGVIRQALVGVIVLGSLLMLVLSARAFHDARLGLSRVVLPPLSGSPHEPKLPWVAASGRFTGDFRHLWGVQARAGGTAVEAFFVARLFSDEAVIRPRARRGDIPDEDSSQVLAWSMDKPVEVLRDPRSGAVTLYSGDRAARFLGGAKVAAWRTIAGPRHGALGLLWGAATGLGAALLAWRQTRRAAAPFEPLASWRDGSVSPDGTIAPADGGATVRAMSALCWRSGSVAFRRAAGPAANEHPDPYRGAPRLEAVEAHPCTSARLAERVTHVRDAWAAWALVVAAAAVAPLAVALLASP